MAISDDTTLLAVRMRAGKQPISRIAKRLGVNADQVRRITNDVRAADLRHGPRAWGDERADIAKAYWRGK
jgi:hypothetical protein